MFTTGSTVYGNFFHVVDLMREIGYDHRVDINHRAFLDAGQRHAADAHRDAADRRIATLQNKRSGGRSTQSLTSKSWVRYDLVAGKHKSPQIAGAVETALGYRNQVPSQQTLSWRGETL